MIKSTIYDKEGNIKKRYPLSDPMIYCIWFIVCEKSSILHNDNVSSDILAEKTKLGASMILTNL